MLEGQDGVGPRGPDMTAKRPQHPQQRNRIARPARCAIERLGRLIERIRFAEEKQVGDAMAARGEAGAEKPGDLLRARVFGLGLYEKDVQLSFAAVQPREFCRGRLAQFLVRLVVEHGSRPLKKRNLHLLNPVPIMQASGRHRLATNGVNARAADCRVLAGILPIPGWCAASALTNGTCTRRRGSTRPIVRLTPIRRSRRREPHSGRVATPRSATAREPKDRPQFAAGTRY
ncbi:hypothetical protein ACVW0J_007698 [Bradyrhizobium sp. i1.7.7]